MLKKTSEAPYTTKVNYRGSTSRGTTHEGDDDVAADVGSDAPEVGETMGRDGVRNDAVDADEQEHDWMWILSVVHRAGCKVQEVNEMWERDTVAGW